MGSLAYTPSHLGSMSGIYRDPHRGKWIIQPLRVHVGQYAQLYHPLDHDRAYQKEVLRDVKFRLRYKWLDNSRAFLPLLEYFRVEHDGEHRVVRLIRNLQQQSASNVSQDDRKYVWRFIEQVWVTDRTVRKAVEKALRKHRMHWYDVLANSGTIKRALARHLQQLITQTVEKLEQRTSNQD